MLVFPTVRFLSDRCKHLLFDLIGIVVVTLFAAVYFYPGLNHGFIFGSLNGITEYPLTSGTFSHVHNLVAGDQFREMSPWLLLNWNAIHAGSLPLWNRYSLLGMPQLANFQSAPFSLPHLVSYIFAAKWGYSVSAFVTILIAGTGTYATARTLGAGVIASIVGAVTFEMSGSFIGWIGWPQAGVNAWLGWVIFFIIMIYRNKRPLMPVVGLSFAVAFLLFAGHPESYLLDSLTIGLLGILFAVIGIAYRKVSLHKVVTTAVYVAGGAILGGMIASPILFPAIQLLAGSAKAGTKHIWGGIPPNVTIQFLATGYYGYPTTTSHWFYGSNFYELSACVGPLIVALAVVALLAYRKRPVVMALVGTFVVLFLVVFRVLPAVQLLTKYLPGGTSVAFGRLLMPMDLLLSVLGALGLSVLLRSIIHNGSAYNEAVDNREVDSGTIGDGTLKGNGRSIALVVFFLSSVLLALILAYLIFSAKVDKVLSPSDRSIRMHSLALSIITLIGGTVVVGIIVVYKKYRLARSAHDGLNGGVQGLKAGVVAIGLSILFLQGVLLVPPAATTEGFSHRFYPTTNSITTLQAIVSGHLVGDGPLHAWYIGPTKSSPLDAFTPETNIPYGVDYFGAYDPMLQKSYLLSWRNVALQLAPLNGMGWFVPSFATAQLARVYGVRYLISIVNAHGKVIVSPGTTSVFEEPGYSIDMVPNSHRFTLVNPSSILHSAEIGSDQFGRVQSWHWTSNNRLTIYIDARHEALLLARITSVPGWHATINGKPAKLSVALDTMLSLNVPAGKSIVRLTYWPSGLTYGIILAGVALLILVVLLGIELYDKLYR